MEQTGEKIDWQVYILYSKERDRYYIGMTSLPITERVRQHNERHYTGKFTARAADWGLKLVILCENKEEAIRLEKRIKQRKSKKFLESLINDESYRNYILEEYRKKGSQVHPADLRD
jgi:putative endonuclease